MMIMKFNDGVSFDTSGELRLTRRHDGLYVVGAGMLCPVASHEEGINLIKQMNKSHGQGADPKAQ